MLFSFHNSDRFHSFVKGRKIRASAHIDELSAASVRGKRTLPDRKSHLFAKNGFNYRKAFFLDADGQYYELELATGLNHNAKTVYNTRVTNVAVETPEMKRIQKEALGASPYNSQNANQYAGRQGSKANPSASNGIVKQSGETDNGQNSQNSYSFIDDSAKTDNTLINNIYYFRDAEINISTEKNVGLNKTRAQDAHAPRTTRPSIANILNMMNEVKQKDSETDKADTPQHGSVP